MNFLRRLVGLGGQALVWLYAAAIVLPIYYVVISAFKENQAIITQPLALPGALKLENFARAWQIADMLSGIVNSVIVTVGAEIVTLLLAIPAAYAIARLKGRGPVWLERFFGLGFLIPAIALLVPTFLFSLQLNLYQTRAFLVLFYPAEALPLSIILLAQFMRTIPGEIEEAARIDGATRFAILVRIFIPLTMPGIITVVLLNFLGFWNEYLFALIITDQATRTVQVALPTLQNAQVIDYGLMAAGTVIALIPVYLVYLFTQRRMYDALVAGAVKG